MPGLRVACSTTLALLTSATAFAHPGHGVGGDWSALHYLREPLHASVVLPLLLAAGLVTLLVGHRRRRPRA